MENPDSGLLRLLHQGYGFSFQKHRSNLYKFSWLRNNREFMVLPFEVPLATTADRERVARGLGLSVADLQAAEQNHERFSKRCLHFVLIITHSHRSLEHTPLDRQADIRKVAEALLQEIHRHDSPQECSLLSGVLDKCKQLAAHPDWAAVGKLAVQLASAGRV